MSRLSKRLLIGSLALNALLLSLWWGGASVRETHADEEKELMPYMQMLQHLTHKLGLSIQAKNQPAASFYITEIDEIVAIVRDEFPTHDNLQIATLANAMLVPSIDPVKKALGGKNWVVTTAAYNKLVDSCNGCHSATNHGYLKITAPTGNPFNQTFSPQ
jgi:hypothetical protein